MNLAVEKSKLSGTVVIPASKSHTIRAVVIGTLADGTSTITSPLCASDPLAAVHVCGKFGAQISQDNDWSIQGVGGRPIAPDDVLDTGNSGTTLYLTMGVAALVNGCSVFTGDEQIRSRPAGSMIEALRTLGAEAYSTRGNGTPPLVVRGPMKGGKVDLDGSKTSQYLSGLLLNCPLAQADTEIRVRDAVEHPFIEMTLGWLDEQGIAYERNGYEWFRVPGGQSFRAFSKRVPGDFSSAAFFLCAAAFTGSELTLVGLDMKDSQGDKAIVDMLRHMSAQIEEEPDGLHIIGGRLKTGGEFDLCGTPDLLPVMAVTACFADGTTRLVNVPQARLKETDRIRVMCKELSKMGARVKELPDGLVVEGGSMRGARVHGHSDHRVVMALAVAGLACKGVTEIDTAEAAAITFPNFVDLMQGIGASMSG